MMTKPQKRAAPVEISIEERVAAMAALDDSSDAVAPAIEPEPEPAVEPPMSIAKPEKSGLDAFKSTRSPTIGNVETLLAALPLGSISEAKDWVRLHPDEENYWSSEYCFVSVPIPGDPKDQLHLIGETLAMQNLPSGRILRFRLALAAKPDNKFFLCRVPSQNLDNSWNKSNIKACRNAQQLWTQATSLKAAGEDHYKVERSRDPDAFPEPDWPSQSLEQLIEATFEGRMILDEDHPAFKRLVGLKQSLA
jgi:hypothetical protein